MVSPSQDGLRHWIFGYGSIVNEASRLKTLAAQAEEVPAPAALVELASDAGYVRVWNFRAPSGFTATGMQASDTPTEICGVLFESAGALGRFDAREVGYDRIELHATHLHILDGHDTPAATALRAAVAGAKNHKFWTYVPRETAAASEEYPICQTYVDACLVGCLERGGVELATRWVRTTGGWSSYVCAAGIEPATLDTLHLLMAHLPPSADSG